MAQERRDGRFSPFEQYGSRQLRVLLNQDELSRRALLPEADYFAGDIRSLAAELGQRRSVIKRVDALQSGGDKRAYIREPT